MTIAGKIQQGERSKALHIAKIMLESGVPLPDIMRFTGGMKKSWLRRVSKIYSPFKSAYTLCFNATSR